MSPVARDDPRNAGDESQRDEALMQRVRGGDRQAFELLYSRYSSPVMRFLYRLCGSRPLAEDLTQDVFLKVWHAAAGWRPIGRVSTWLFQIAKHHWWNEAAKRKLRAPIRGTNTRPEDAGDQTDAEAPTPGDTLARAESAAAIEEALLALSPRLRVVFVLVRLEGVSYAETAEIVGIPVGTVKSRAAAAEAWLRQRLRDALEP
jgi:RNA polymerase sigma-70 factor (ECF subfamily)